MQLQPSAFNAFLAGIGQGYTWRKSYACPCVNPISGAAKKNCPHCSGRGRIWDAGKPGVAGMAGSKTQREWAQFGVWESGDVVVTIPENTPIYEIGQYDRMTATNSTEQFSMPLIRGENDRLHFQAQEISRVFWINDAGAIVDGGIPAVSATGVLSWSSGEPPDGQQYSINGKRFLEYYCWGQFPSNRNEHQGARLPKRVVLRRWDLFGRKGD